MLSNCDEVTPYVHDLYGLVFCANYCLWKERREIARGARCNKISINCARSCISYLSPARAFNTRFNPAIMEAAIPIVPSEIAVAESINSCL
ncbi:hypothetical protein MRB53_000390 [Persea americana]|uniref:Uncharacterized protein n=1 Tax=Persea americana TaxID=3435 RepID=A0ACC2MNP4_PERAE|nr:hypothetical protein MRB53_000390 [Persea americana]